MDFVAIDFETANEKRCSPCAVGLAVVSAGRLVESISWLIKPPQDYFNRFNVMIHGITAADVQDAPEFNELWSTLAPYLAGQTVIAHNAGFDMSVLKRTMDYYGMAYPEFDYACTHAIARRAWPGLGSYRLNVIAGHLGIDFHHHDAAEDAAACAQIALSAGRLAHRSTFGDLLKHLGISRQVLRKTGDIMPISQRALE